MRATAEHPIIVPKTTTIRILERRDFHPWKHFSNSNKYLIMDNVAKHILLNTHQDNNYLPPVKITKMTLISNSVSYEVIRRLISKKSSFMTPLYFCHVAAALTDKQPEGEDGFLRTDGKKTIIGFFDAQNAITVFWCHVLKKWVFDWHPSSEFSHETDLLVVHSSMIDLHLFSN